MTLRQAMATCGTVVWVSEDAKVGESIKSPSGQFEFVIYELLGIWSDDRQNNKTIEKREFVKAEDLLVGDEIYYCNEWRTVISTYVHPKSIYSKPTLSQSNSTLPLSVRIGRNTKIERKTRGYLMSVSLMLSHELVKSLQSKLSDFQALVNAPERVEVVPSVFVDKEPIMHALKDSIKAEYSKLGEQLKKL